MKRIFLVATIFFLSFSLFAAIAPYSQKIGRVVVDFKEGSTEELISNALREEFSLSWIEKYTFGDDAFLESYSSILSSLLPMSNLLVGEFDGVGLGVISQDSGDCLYLTIKEGRITALQKK